MRIAIGLGSSLGDRRPQLERVVAKLAARADTTLIRGSRWYRTPPMRGGTARGWFLNGVVLFETSLDPHAFLAACVALEQRLGRRRAGYWGDRTVDIDLLLAEGVTVDTETLTLPHPAIARRPFVLLPLVEAWPEARHPTTGDHFADLPVPPGRRPVPVGVLARRPGSVRAGSPT